jgi:protein-disulfide isomerase
MSLPETVPSANPAKRFTLITAILLGLGVVAAVLWFALRPDFTPAPVGYEDQPTLGQRNAPLKVILFENFMCEHCKVFEADVFPALKRDYIDTGKVEVYYLNLAWGSEQAELSALAGECAYRQDESAFWNFKSDLYAAQGSWQTLDDLLTVAGASYDVPPLRQCIEEKRYTSEVQRDLDLADKVGVQGTPSIVVGNQGFEAPDYATLKQAIDAQLSGS